MLVNKLKRILLAILPILFISGCTIFQKTTPKKTEKIQKDIIEVEKKPVNNKIDVKTTTFASDIIMDKLNKDNENRYNCSRVNDLSQIETLDFDIAIIPAYQVTNIYSKTNENIKLAAITAVNNIHIISDKQINSPGDMLGMTIMVPELNESLNKLIDSKLGLLKSLMKINTEFYYNQKDILKNLENSDNIIAILSEPYYSIALEGRSFYSFDLNKTISMLPNSNSTGDFLSEVIIVNKKYLRDNRESFDRFLEEYKSAQQNIDENFVLSQSIINNYDVTNEEATRIYKSIDHTFIDSDTMVGVYEIYMDKLENLDKNIFNGKRPTNDIYYKN